MRFIPITERVPDIEEDILFYDDIWALNQGKHAVYNGRRLVGDHPENTAFMYGKVDEDGLIYTHWMPTPSPTKFKTLYPLLE